MKPEGKDRQHNFMVSGSFGPGVVIQSGCSNAINIAGGENSGDVYLFNGDRPPSFDDVRKIIAERLPPDQVERICEPLAKIENEIVRGDSTNIGYVEMILWTVLETEPQLVRLLARAIIARTNNPIILSLAQDFLGKAPLSSAE